MGDTTNNIRINTSTTIITNSMEGHNNRDLVTTNTHLHPRGRLDVVDRESLGTRNITSNNSNNSTNPHHHRAREHPDHHHRSHRHTVI